MSFKAPCDCTAVAGLKAYFPNEKGIITTQTFMFTDAHGNNLAGLGHLFTKGAIVKAILNLDEGKAYLQNADTNAYLEGKFEEKADLVDGKVPAEQLPEMNYIPSTEKGVAEGVATLGPDGKVPTGQLPSMGYSKVETLSDATKAMFGLGTYAVPEDVFSFLGKYNQHWWKRRTNSSHYAPDIYDLVETANVFRSNNKGDVGVQYSEALAINHETGAFDLLNPQSILVGYNSSANANVLKGKYFKPMDYGTAQSIRFVQKDAADAYAQLESNKYVVKMASYAVRTVFVDGKGEWEFVHSSDENTYPMPNDVFEYQYIGIPFQNFLTTIKFASGSYVGTGTQNRIITLGFEPKIVFLFGTINSTGAFAYFTENGQAYATSGSATGSTTNNYWVITKDGFMVGKTYSWMNESGKTTSYFAIG